MKKLGLALVCVLCSFGLQAQDIHFSQYIFSSLHVNPGYTGVFNGNIRAQLNYKDQWTTFGNGFRTYAFSYDQKLMQKKWNGSWLGVGLTAFRDEAGDLQLGNTKAMLSVSGVVKLDLDKYLSMGIQGGATQRTMNMGNMRWDDQYDGIMYNPLIQTQDDISFTPFMQPDFSAGIVYDHFDDQSNMISYDVFHMKIGASVHHLTKPYLAYQSTDERMYMKYIVQGHAFVGFTNTEGGIIPSFFLAKQGPSREALLGLAYRIRLKEAAHFTGFIREAAWSFGADYRFGDAFIPKMAFEANKFTIGVSYDFNVSRLNAATNHMGGLEVSLTFINPDPMYYRKKGGSVPKL